jgi:plastocyanin/heme-degrading monooxygenase HmoA
MDAHATDHGGDHGQGHAVHLPDPSIWPFVVGLASLLAGVALIWWSRDSGNAFAGPMVGAALAVVLISAGGWAWEDSRMRRKAEEGHGPEPRAPRYNQVITFAIPESVLDAARGKDGVLAAIDAADLRDLEGFEDLRITVSAATEGPSQVLVETTWRGREGIADYEASRQTLLDILTQHSDQVVPGTVQVFDMEVVRDTKDTAFRFSLGAAVTVIAGLIVGGFALGGALSLFQSEATAGGGNGEPPPPADPYEVIGRDNFFTRTTLEAPPETEVTFTFANRGRSLHNLAFYTDSSASTPLAEGAVGAIIPGGQTAKVTFTTPGPGTYFFHCDLHPDTMKGEFIVREGAPPPGGGAPAAAGG